MKKNIKYINPKRPNQFKTFRTLDLDLRKNLKNDNNFKKAEINKLKEFYKILGYDINGKFIQGYWDNKVDKLSWNEVHHNGGLITVNKYNSNTREWYSDYTVWLLEEECLKHTYSLELKKAPSKIEVSVPKQSSEESFEIWKGIKYIDKTLCGSYFMQASNILAIDIDNHNNQASLLIYTQVEQMIKNIGVPIFTECSAEGSYHLFFKLDRIYTEREKKDFIDQYNKKYHTDIHYVSKMRFPLSYTYEPLNVTSSFFDQEGLSPQEAIQSTFDRYNNFEGIKLFSEEKQKDIVLKEDIVISNIYRRQKQFNIPSPEEMKDKILLNPDLNMSRGDRYFKMLEIIRTCKMHGINIDDTVQILHDKNYDSEYFQKNSNDKIYKDVEDIYNKSIMQYLNISSSRPEEFQSNIELVPESIKNLIKKTSVIDEILFNSKRKITDLNRERFELVFLEMIGYMFYNCKNPKQLKDNTKFENQLLIGYQFSQAYCDLMKSYYPILAQADVYDIMNSICKCSKIFNQHYSNHRGWYYNSKDKSNNFCRQFYLSSNNDKSIINDIDILFFHIRKSIFNVINTCVKLLNNISNNYNANKLIVTTHMTIKLKQLYISKIINENTYKDKIPIECLT